VNKPNEGIYRIDTRTPDDRNGLALTNFTRSTVLSEVTATLVNMRWRGHHRPSQTRAYSRSEPIEKDLPSTGPKRPLILPIVADGGRTPRRLHAADQPEEAGPAYFKELGVYRHE